MKEVVTFLEKRVHYRVTAVEAKPSILSSGCVRISLDYRKVLINAYEIDLPRRELDLFCMLASETERIFTYEHIFARVWKGYPRRPVRLKISGV